MLGEQHGGGADHGHTQGGEQLGAAPAQGGKLAAEQGHASAEHEFKQAGGQQVVGGRRVGAGQVHRQRKGAHQSDAERPVAVTALTEPVGQVQGQGPDQVELLFHCQGPGVQQRQGAGFRGEVLAQFLEIVDVAQAHQG